MSENTQSKGPLDETSPLLGGVPVAADNAPERVAGSNGCGDAEPLKDGDADLPKELSLAKLTVVMLAVWSGVFLAAVDTTVISTLLAPISSSFSSFASISWVASAYLISNAALQPLFGRLTDIYGRRSGLVICNILFAAGTLMCGLAKNEYTMIAGRVIAGAGGGGMTTISSIVATDLVPLRKRGIVQGGGNLSYGAGAALGGVFGGFIHDCIGWRWAFLIQVPFIIVSTIMVAMFVRIPIKKSNIARHRRIDYAGAFTLVMSLVLLLIALSTGGNILPWTHPLILVCLPLSVVFLFAFGYIEKNVAQEPIIPVGLLGDRTVLAACMTNWFMVMSVFSLYFYCPIYFMVRGQSSTDAGLRLTPFAAGISVGSLSTGIAMNRTGHYYKLGLLAMLVYNSGVAAICTFNLNTPLFPQFFNFFVFGCGYGGVLTVTLLALIAAVGRKDQAVITSASYAFRSTGSTIGATVGSAIFQNVLKRRLVTYLGNGEEARRIIGQVRERFDAIDSIPGEYVGRVRGAYMDALHAVFYASLGMGILAMVCAAWMREHKLHKTLDRN
ncbi:major facilitator superfamily domain-containing protein [Morchella snyderi]|nr:major facilitator superfamily domain-containing protein [Morchella snyderi]